jgi:hypothetical protein
VELTEVHTGGKDRWTLGLRRPARPICSAVSLEATAALVFAQPLPGGVQPGPDESRSYAQWLGQQPGADRNTGA